MITSRENVLFSGVPCSGVALLPLPGAAVDAQETADLIICTARITTQVGGGEAPLAVAVEDDKIMAAGSDRDLLALPSPEELTRAAPNRQVFVPHLPSGGFYNDRGVDVARLDAATGPTDASGPAANVRCHSDHEDASR